MAMTQNSEGGERAGASPPERFPCEAPVRPSRRARATAVSQRSPKRGMGAQRPPLEPGVASFLASSAFAVSEATAKAVPTGTGLPAQPGPVRASAAAHLDN
jgi:hypothetical protein